MARHPPRDYQRAAVDALFTALKRVRSAKGVGCTLHLGTGGGKTFTANALVSRWQAAHPTGYVLWVSQSWWLLRQAAANRAAHADSAAASDPNEGPLYRFGGAAAALRLPHVASTPAGHPRPPPGAVVYTTLQTFLARKRGGQLRAPRPSLVVWDECHHGEHAQSGRALRAWLKGRDGVVPILGLTATPRRTTTLPPAFSRTFSQLVADRYLAAPRFVDVRTELSWTPTRSLGSHGDFSPSDLRVLATSDARNRQILSHYDAHRQRYGQTLVFACDVDHADALAALATRYGVSAVSVHSGNSREANAAAVDRFRVGAYAMIVSVGMMTHGVDLPSIDTVFLCRPTLSDILFAQMAGRGARIPGGERREASFNLVEFTDNVERFGDALVTARTFFDGAGSAGLSSGGGGGAGRHAFDPTGQLCRLTAAGLPAHPALVGALYRQGQTFGFEVELTIPGGVPGPRSRRWRQVADAVHGALRSAAPGHVTDAPSPGYHRGGHERWKTEHDSSTGWEVVSRVLQGEAGVAELARVLDALDALAAAGQVRVNHRTGLHLHLGWGFDDEDSKQTAARLWRLLRWVHLLEPWLGSLVAPSRVADYQRGRYAVGRPNPYCAPVSSVYGDVIARRKPPALGVIRRLASRGDHRNCTVNLQPLFAGLDTVEVRLHSGTTDAVKAGWWLALWTGVLWLAEYGYAPVGSWRARSAVVPDFGPPAWAAQLPAIDGWPAVMAWAARRRAEVQALWHGHPDLRGHVEVLARSA